MNPITGSTNVSAVSDALSAEASSHKLGELENTSNQNTYKEISAKNEVLQFRSQFQYFKIVALVLMSIWSSRVLAQDGHSHSLTPQAQELTLDQTRQQNELLKRVRESTARFKDVKVAENDGYRLEFGCVSGDDFGAMAGQAI